MDGLTYMFKKKLKFVTVCWSDDTLRMVLRRRSASMKVLRRSSNARIVPRRAATRRSAGLSLLAKSSTPGMEWKTLTMLRFINLLSHSLKLKQLKTRHMGQKKLTFHREQGWPL